MNDNPRVSPARRFPPTGAERAFATAFLVLAVTAWCAFSLAELGLFTPRRWLATAAPLFAAGTWWIWRERTASRADGSIAVWHGAVLSICLVATAVVARPIDYVIDGNDASVYVNIAEIIEQRGGARVLDPLLTGMDDTAREALFERDTMAPHLLNYFPGGIQIGADGTHLQPGFFHLLPATLAGFSVLTGSPTGGLLVLPFAAMLTIAAVWLVAARLSSPVAATTAVVLLTLNFAHIWFARFPSSEALTACLLVSGLFFTLRAAQDGSRLAASLGGAAFGLAACARLEVLILVSPLIVGYLIVVACRREWTPATTWLAAAFGVFTSQALLHAGITAAPYTERILRVVFATDWWIGRTTMLLPAAMVIGATTIWLAWRLRHTMDRVAHVRGFLALILLAAIVRSWPQLWSGSASVLLTPFGLMAMTCGAAWLALGDDRSPEAVLVVALFVLSAVVYVEAPRAGSWYPLEWRRFVPIVLPLGFVLVGHAVAVLWRQHAPWRWSAGVLAAFLVVTSARASQALVTMTPMAGVRDRMARIAGSLPDNSVLITDATTPSHFGLTLHFTFGRPVVWLRHSTDTRGAIERFADALDASGRSLTLAISPDDAPGALKRSDFARRDLIPRDHVLMTWQDILLSRGIAPRYTRSPGVRIEQYDVVPARPRALPVTIDVGFDDFNWRGGGFYGPELAGEAAVRWTGGRADILLPQIEPVANARLVARIAAPRPADHAPVTATFLLDDLVIGTAPSLPGHFAEVAFQLTTPVIDRLVRGVTHLTLRAPVFVPRDNGMGDDTRELGVMVDWLHLDLP